MIFPNKEGVDLNGDSFYSTYTLRPRSGRFSEMRSDLPPNPVQILTDNSCHWAIPLDGDTFNASYTLHSTQVQDYFCANTQDLALKSFPDNECVDLNGDSL